MNKEELRLILKQYSLDDKIDQLERFMNYTLEANQKFNLTAIKNEEDFREKMILDCLLPLPHFSFANKSLIDVGTGAGFPGMVLAIASGAKVTMLDSTAKKIKHLEKFAKEEDIKANFVIDRIENYSKSHAETYDLASARAVSALNILLEIVMPLIKVGGYFIAYKGPSVDEEIKQAEKAFSKLDCHIETIIKEELPSKDIRNILIIKKDKTTNKKYPRDYSEIVKKPL